MHRTAHSFDEWLSARWYSLVVAVSVALVLATFLSFAFQNPGSIPTRILFLIGLSGENNVGAWWSGMLLLVSGVLAFDGYRLRTADRRERAGWCMLFLILVGMSFDELASVHEQMNLWVYGLVGLTLLIYAVVNLLAGGANRRLIALTLTSFLLFATIAGQEYLQHALEWRSPVLYGLRGMIEEGTEIFAMLIMLKVAATRTSALNRSQDPDAITLVNDYRTLIIRGAVIMLPLLVGATFVLPEPPGPAGWLSSALMALCALAVLRKLLRSGSWSGEDASLFGIYLAISAASCAVDFRWDVDFAGISVSVLAVVMFLLLIAASLLLQKAGRLARWRSFRAGAFVVLAFAWWSPDQSAVSQVAWCSMPAVFALWLYAIESGYQSKSPAPPAAHRVGDLHVPRTFQSAQR